MSQDNYRDLARGVGSRVECWVLVVEIEALLRTSLGIMVSTCATRPVRMPLVLCDKNSDPITVVSLSNTSRVCSSTRNRIERRPTKSC